jgi:hypothetical protein
LRPLTEAEGYPATRITGLAGDPELDAVWITAIGEILFYRPAIDQLVRTIIAGRVDRIFFDRLDPGGGAYVGYADQWARVSPAGFATPVPYDRLPPAGQRDYPPTLEMLREDIPSLESFAGLLTRDDALRSWRLTSGARRPGRSSEVWLGTAGGGLYLADPLFNRARHVPYGLFERGASSLALSSNGVWVGSLGMDLRATGGVVAASADLQEWDWLRGPPDGSMAGLRVHDIVVHGGTILAATDRGLAVRAVGVTASGRPAEWEWVFGTRSGRVFALAVSSAHIWIGQDRGLSMAPRGIVDGVARRDPLVGDRALRDIGGGPVRALLLTGDTLWVGTDTEVMRLRFSEDRVDPVNFARPLPPWLRRPIVALARSDSVVVAATSERIALIHPRDGVMSAMPGDVDLSRLGRLFTVAIDARSIWVGGDRGAAVIDRATGLTQSVNPPGVLAEAVLDIVLQPQFAWLATPAGLVRIRRLPDGSAR